MLNGCNSHNGVYQAFQNGTIKFGEFVGTKRACSQDFDSKYLEALRNSVSFTKSSENGRITLFDAYKQVTIILTPYVAKPEIKP